MCCVVPTSFRCQAPTNSPLHFDRDPDPDPVTTPRTTSMEVPFSPSRHNPYLSAARFSDIFTSMRVKAHTNSDASDSTTTTESRGPVEMSPAPATMLTPMTRMRECVRLPVSVLLHDLPLK